MTKVRSNSGFSQGQKKENQEKGRKQAALLLNHVRKIKSSKRDHEKMSEMLL
jgi:hypothetical protein